MRPHIILAFLLLPAMNTTSAQPSPRQAADLFLEAHGPQILRDYAEFLAVPNVASDSVGIHRNAAFIQKAFEHRGVHIEQLTLPGSPPLIYGEIETAGATRTIGIYAHYDGQPVDESRWTHRPWTPTLYTRSMELGGESRPFPESDDLIDPDWYLYARSASDDKAPLAAMLAGLDALQEAGLSLTSNVKFMFDGEEEANSPHLAHYLDAFGDRYEDVDLWLFCDGPMHQSRRPQIVFGARGLIGMQVTVYGATRPLHSGHYGNWAPQAGFMLADLLASMRDDDGRVLIDRFYDSTDPVGDAEREALAQLSSYDDTLRSELGLARTEGGGVPLPELLLRPALNLRGISSGNVGEDTRNIIPSTATAALGLRLVEGNDPESMVDLVEAHIRDQGFHIVHEDPDHETRMAYPKIAKVTRGEGYPAARSPMDLPMLGDVAAAVMNAAGEEPILVPTFGGSIPLYLFTETLSQPAIFLPIVNHDNNQHAADENVRVGNLMFGVRMFAELYAMP